MRLKNNKTMSQLRPLIAGLKGFSMYLMFKFKGPNQSNYEAFTSSFLAPAAVHIC